MFHKHGHNHMHQALHSCYLPPSTICPQPGYPSPYPIPVTSCLLTEQRPLHYPILATLSLWATTNDPPYPTALHKLPSTRAWYSLPWGRLVLSRLEISRVLQQSWIHCPGIKSKLLSVIWFSFLTSSYLYWNLLESLFRENSGFSTIQIKFWLFISRQLWSIQTENSGLFIEGKVKILLLKTSWHGLFC